MAAVKRAEKSDLEAVFKKVNTTLGVGGGGGEGGKGGGRGRGGASLIAGLEYGMERWNGTMNVQSCG